MFAADFYAGVSKLPMTADAEVLQPPDAARGHAGRIGRSFDAARGVPTVIRRCRGAA
jgi:hypothetical protein